MKNNGIQKFPLHYPNDLSFPISSNTKNNKIIHEQLFSQYKEFYELFEYEPIIKNVAIKMVSGYPIPHLIVSNSENLEYMIPLFGLIYLALNERTCVYCGSKITLNRYEPICEECSTIERNYGQLCRFDGPGSPFGVICDPENPPCVRFKGPKGCFNKHYVYIACLGSKIKVGISSEKRNNGIYTRLLEQGIRKAIVIRSFKNLHEAMKAENIVSNELSISKRITMVEKSIQITEEDVPIHQPTHWINKEIHKIFPDKKIISLNLFERPSFIKNKKIIVQEIVPPVLDAEIVYSLGKLLILTIPPVNEIYNEQAMVILNAEKLAGYKIEIPEII